MLPDRRRALADTEALFFWRRFIAKLPHVGMSLKADHVRKQNQIDFP
ncbi:hypothetical protein RBSH_01593 [Rhodopirellula baltica SH28]|uniref:Uncharacterized protein n=1 Tax=Rhodopirellula baltica SH28 TaxID=993517 RepID=K5CFZ1_RHOBT|nr:hypothetical protein RBSH_01593 [Rhodopirellula baltica SH28]|tara:strand:- start:2190 stop:2330 length:141 start_codon:yes stop_codon:yes gene_type:complete